MTTQRRKSTSDVPETGERLSQSAALSTQGSPRHGAPSLSTAFTIELIVQRTHPEDRAIVQQAIDRASTEGREFDLEHRLQMPDGSIKHVRVVGRPSKTDKSRDRQFVGAVTDITDRKRAQFDLQKAAFGSL